MSRSRRKTPICAMTKAASDHAWKKAAARRLRHRRKQVIAATLEEDRFDRRGFDVTNPAGCAKDGKGWLRDPAPKLLRK